MNTNILFAVYESCGHYDGTPKILEVFVSKIDAESFLEKKREELKDKWTEDERKKWRDKNLRKKDVSKALSNDEIEKIMSKYAKTIDNVVHFSIKMDTLDKVIEQIRKEIHSVYASMEENY